MYYFDPSLTAVLAAAAAVLAVSVGLSWLASPPEGAGGGEEGAAEGAAGAGREPAADGPDGGEELRPHQRFILWGLGAGLLVFLLWWATLSTGSRAAPGL